MRLFIASIRRLIRRPVSFITLGLLIGLLTLFTLAVGATARAAEAQGQGGQAALLLVTFPGAYTLIMSFVLGLGGLLALTYGAAVSGSEWNWGTLKASVARGESRTIYQLATFGSIAVLIGVGLVLAFVAGVVAAVIGAALAAVPTGGMSDPAALGELPDLFARGWLGVVEQAALGFAIATLARSQLAGIGVGIGVYFAGIFGAIFLPQIVKFSPFQAASALVATPDSSFGGGQSLVDRLDASTALLVVVAWLIGSLVVSALFTERAEITG